MAVSRGPKVLVGRSVIPQVGPGHQYLMGFGPGWGLGHGRIQRAEGTSVWVGLYIRRFCICGLVQFEHG